MKHLNNDILCSVGMQTTGPLPYHHEVLQVAVIPLTTNIRPRQDLLPFDVTMKLGRPENFSYEDSRIGRKKFLEMQEFAIDSFDAADRFELWFDTLKLRFNKRIEIIGYDTPKIMGFLQDWLGPKNFERYFDYRHRDVVTIASFLNDHSDFTGAPYVVQKTDLAYLAHVFKIDTSAKTRDAIEEAMVVAEIYKNMIQKHVTKYEQHQRKAMVKLLDKIRESGVDPDTLSEIEHVLKNEKVEDET